MNCIDCLCRICARNRDNDSLNKKLAENEKNCSCNVCDIFGEIVLTETDCDQYLEDEEL